MMHSYEQPIQKLPHLRYSGNLGQLNHGRLFHICYLYGISIHNDFRFRDTIQWMQRQQEFRSWDRDEEQETLCGRYTTVCMLKSDPSVYFVKMTKLVLYFYLFLSPMRFQLTRQSSGEDKNETKIRRNKSKSYCQVPHPEWHPTR